MLDPAKPDIQSDIPSASADLLQFAIEQIQLIDLAESCDTNVLLTSMTTNTTDRQSRVSNSDHGGSEKDKLHAAKPTERSSTVDDKGSRRVAEGFTFDRQKTHQESRTNIDNNPEQPASKSRSLEGLRSNGRAKSPSKAPVTARSKGGATKWKDGR